MNNINQLLRDLKNSNLSKKMFVQIHLSQEKTAYVENQKKRVYFPTYIFRRYCELIDTYKSPLGSNSYLLP